MRDLNQLILNFDYDQNFKDQDFYVSKSNEFAFKLLNSWPKWEKNFVNLIGENFSGKTHLVNIFLHKFKGIKIEANEINTSVKISLTVSINNNNNSEISKFEEILDNADLVYNYYIYKFNNRNSFYKIIFNGSPDYFLKIMKNKNYEFDIQNQIWVVK